MLTAVQFEVLKEQLHRNWYRKTFQDETEGKMYENAMLETISVVKSVGLCAEVSTPEQELEEMIRRLQEKPTDNERQEIADEYLAVYQEGICDAISVIKGFYADCRNRI